MQLAIYHVDAFSGHVFGGNPAAVVPLEEWLPDDTLQSIAAENALSETAFFVRTDESYHIRWMTPVSEVDLCGHATLAAAFVLLSETHRDRDEIVFRSASGPLRVERDGELLALDFPSRPPKPEDLGEALHAALGARPLECLAARDAVALFESEAEVRGLRPRMDRIAEMPHFGVIATAPGVHCDFVSRYFAPRVGIPEDPVTGSAHSTLVPFWSSRLGRSSLHALQVSKRGGELFCEARGERVKIAGRAVLYLRGTITI
jgi:PhzF family phenazine biosynthesis protein